MRSATRSWCMWLISTGSAAGDRAPKAPRTPRSRSRAGSACRRLDQVRRARLAGIAPGGAAADHRHAGRGVAHASSSHLTRRSRRAPRSSRSPGSRPQGSRAARPGPPRAREHANVRLHCASPDRGGRCVDARGRLDSWRVPAAHRMRVLRRIARPAAPRGRDERCRAGTHDDDSGERERHRGGAERTGSALADAGADGRGVLHGLLSSLVRRRAGHTYRSRPAPVEYMQRDGDRG